jgi:O-succinylbenzoic acid--CoA ligase
LCLGAPRADRCATLSGVSSVEGLPAALGRRLRAVPVEPGAAAVAALLPALRAALNGSGDPVLPHAADRPPPRHLGPGEPLAPGEDDEHDPTVVVVATSGSTGAPKGVLLPASALLASASATHDRLGGPGRWLLALPAQHVAGVQVLVRSLVSRTEPAVLDLATGFTAEAFAATAAAMPAGRRRYTALVPTQLVRLLEAADAGADDGLRELARFDAVLVGGAGTPAPVLQRAADAGVRVVTTYGASETCGGCVYDGVPLDGVLVSIDDGLDDSAGSGRVLLAGPTLARGYRGGDPDGAFTVDGDGTRWWRTADAGRVDDGRLTVLGRLDDAVLTGGATVLPSAVEAVLLTAPGIAQAVVTGVDDPQWGRRVVAAVVPAPGAPAPTLDDVRALVADRLGPWAAPRQLLVLDAMPSIGVGKPDRAAVARLAAEG